MRIHRFEPYRLPDSRGTCVVAAAGCKTPGLFSTWLMIAARVIPDANDEVVCGAGAGLVRDVERERDRAAEVGAHGHPVDKCLAFIIRAAKVKPYALARPRGRYLDLAVIPHGPDEVLVCDAGEFALRAERHGNRLIKARATVQGTRFGHATLAEVKRVRPRAVQIDPRIAPELRSRMLRAGDIAKDCGPGPGRVGDWFTVHVSCFPLSSVQKTTMFGGGRAHA